MLHDQSDFEYDYETLRTTGVIIGVILFVSGILIALSKKLTCSKSSSNSNTAGTQIPKTDGERERERERERKRERERESPNPLEFSNIFLHTKY
uniref:FXYD domain-containing ion transport regulator n=1 Tax=Salmo trutta TaxID=8032 RepID=A0A673X8B7_SALTR